MQPSRSNLVVRYAGLVALAACGVLLVPLVLMQFSDAVAWGAGDFVVAGGLLFLAGMTGMLAARHVEGAGRKAAIAAAVFGILAVVWAELAVSIFS